MGISPTDNFLTPGIVRISDAALNYAREFAETVGRSQRGDWVVTFDWAQSLSYRPGPDAPEQNIGPCLMLGAYERHQIPAGCTQSAGDIEFAVRIPDDVWQQGVHRTIDLNESLLFKLVLR